MKKILVIEDDKALNSGLCFNLEIKGYETGSALTMEEGNAKLSEGKWDLLLLDVNLPDGNGFDFGKRIKSSMDIPLIFITGNDLDENIIQGFDSGADDYITKPFNIEIVLKRIDAVLKRTSGKTSENIIRTGNLEIDFDAMVVIKNEKIKKLTPTEFKLLEIFTKNKGIVLKRDVLLEKLWDKDGNFVDDHTLTINISRLKSKLADREYTYIKTIYGIGYQWIGEKDD